MMECTAYLKQQLDAIGWPCRVNQYSNTVFFKRPSPEIVRKYSRFYTEKSRNISGGQLNLVIELAVNKGDELAGELSSMRSVHSVSLLSHDGEVTF